MGNILKAAAVAITAAVAVATPASAGAEAEPGIIQCSHTDWGWDVVDRQSGLALIHAWGAGWCPGAPLTGASVSINGQSTAATCTNSFCGVDGWASVPDCAFVEIESLIFAVPDPESQVVWTPSRRTATLPPSEVC